MLLHQIFLFSLVGMTYDGSLDKWYSTSLEGTATWNDASAICSSRGQHLMYIAGTAEQTKLDSFGGDYITLIWGPYYKYTPTIYYDQN